MILTRPSRLGSPVPGSHARGFTLMELLIALLIVGLLVGVVAQNLFGNVAKAERTVAKQEVSVLSKALDTYYLDVRRYPTTEQGLAALTKQPAGVTNWKGPYLQKDVTQDPWGNPYVYKSPGEHRKEYDLASFGKDGKLGGTDEDEDIVNW